MSSLPQLLSASPADQATPLPGSVGQLLGSYVYVFYAAFIVAIILTPIMRIIAIRFHIIDHPDGKRKVHREPVAYLGGIAVFAGCAAGILCSRLLYPHWWYPSLLNHVQIDWWLMAGALVIVLVGLVDDARGITPKQKIAGQLAAGLCLASTQLAHRSAWGLVQPILTFFGLASSGFETWQYSWAVAIVSLLFVLVVVVGCCNACNLMDGLDGLCGGVTAIMAASFLVLSVSLALFHGPGHEHADATRMILSLALLGAVLGFIPYNFNPASIFMGDAGSMFLGHCCAALLIFFAAEGELKWFLGGCVAFALPLFDTALAFVRRKVNGRPFFSADRQHLHHQLLARGLSVRGAVLTCYGLAVCCGVLGCSIVFLRTSFVGAIYLLVFSFVAVAAYKIGMVHEKVAQVASAVEVTPHDPASNGRRSNVVDTTEVAAADHREPVLEVAGR